MMYCAHSHKFFVLDPSHIHSAFW